LHRHQNLNLLLKKTILIKKHLSLPKTKRSKEQEKSVYIFQFRKIKSVRLTTTNPHIAKWAARASLNRVRNKIRMRNNQKRASSRIRMRNLMRNHPVRRKQTLGKIKVKIKVIIRREMKNSIIKSNSNSSLALRGAVLWKIIVRLWKKRHHVLVSWRKTKKSSQSKTKARKDEK